MILQRRTTNSLRKRRKEHRLTVRFKNGVLAKTALAVEDSLESPPPRVYKNTPTASKPAGRKRDLVSKGASLGHDVPRKGKHHNDLLSQEYKSFCDSLRYRDAQYLPRGSKRLSKKSGDYQIGNTSNGLKYLHNIWNLGILCKEVLLPYIVNFAPPPKVIVKAVTESIWLLKPDNKFGRGALYNTVCATLRKALSFRSVKLSRRKRKPRKRFVLNPLLSRSELSSLHFWLAQSVPD